MAKISVAIFNELVRLRFKADHPTMDMDWNKWISEVRNAINQVLKETA